MNIHFIDIIILLALAISSFCCSSNTRPQLQTQNRVQQQDTNKISNTQNLLLKDSVRVLFDNTQSFEILSLKRGITTQSSADDTNMCKGWTISKNQLYKIILNSKPLSGTVWDLMFEVLPCITSGQLSQFGRQFEFELNAGSWIYINCQDTTLLFGDFKKQDRRYFVSAPDVE
jgi:hypothetical protein